ncbi:adenylate/guanylate cyclase domain-containing protein [Epibacterium ulvae]|uniref:adenylate/guanylate cyclase domain-containing protein n=1 Tax=Epibacterium ulvae TaxID=1156985 RepID=UPI001BFC3B31|nr:adenylate/guanylate cyclase domain-containing protein [Epibacterium ulvae]MBT8155080.1 adenylate/guanylate cyclase domain-containing protein [Epibacterium ulvae]
MGDLLKPFRSTGQASVARSLLREAQIDAERVVARLRIAVSIGLFLTIFFVVTEVPVEGRAYIHRQILIAVATLAAYMVLGILSLWMLHRGWFRAWMIWIVATADCLFLVANSTLSVVNSGLPGDNVFVMPSVWLMPITLAFAVLRFNPAIQIYTVVMIVVGHGLLLPIMPDVVVEDTLRQLQSTLRRQPNVARLAMVAFAGSVLVVAALRTRRLLRHSIREATQKAKLTRYLPAQIVGDLAEQDPDALRQGQQQQAAVLFVDIRGFTRWSEGRAPDEVGAFITEFRRRIERAVQAHDGVIDKYIGDAAMVFFVGEQEAARGIACAQAILAEIATWSDRLRADGEDPVAVGVGLHLGPVFLGVVGTQERLEYTVLGDTVNVAARLQDACKPTQQKLIVSADTLDAALPANAPARAGWIALQMSGLRGRSGEVALFGWAQGASGDAPSTTSLS